MKTIIYSCHINANYIELQYESIKKFFKTDYEYIVFNDARTENHLTTYNEIHTDLINNICSKLNIKCVRIPPELHFNRSKVLPECYLEKDDHPVTRCALAVQYGFNYVINNYKDEYLFLIDSDMFFIDHFNIENYMSGKDIAGITQGREQIVYLWNGLFICSLSNCKNLNLFSWEAGRVVVLDENMNITNQIIPTDVGGHNYHYLKKNHYLDGMANNGKLKKISNLHTRLIESYVLNREGVNPLLSEKILQLLLKLMKIPSPPSPHENYLNKEIALDKTIIHIRGGGGWCYHQKEYHLECVKIIKNYIEEN